MMVVSLMAREGSARLVSSTFVSWPRGSHFCFLFDSLLSKMKQQQLDVAVSSCWCPADDHERATMKRRRLRAALEGHTHTALYSEQRQCVMLSQQVVWE